ncbi:MAG: hypothetical protein ACRDTX_08180 [Pseudonocardiaceae bacterium]
MVPLTRQPGPLQAFKLVIPATQCTPEPCTHEGYEWRYVLSGRSRLILADLVLRPGEAGEFDRSNEPSASEYGDRRLCVG